MTGCCKRLALNVAGLIFLVVAVAHFVRYHKAWVITVDHFTVPMHWSMYGGIIAAVLAFYMFCSARQK